MGIAQIPAPSGGLAVARFPARAGAPFNIPAGLTLQNTVTSTTTFSAGQLPAQVFAVIVGGGGSGGAFSGNTQNGGGGGGGVKIGWVDVPSAGITATIGAGGAVVTPSDSGNKGGTTIFGSILVGGGGGGVRNGDGQFSLQGVTSIPNREGLAGYGGSANGTILQPNSNALSVGPSNAPYGFTEGTIAFSSGASTLSAAVTGLLTNLWDNYSGGGAGGAPSIRTQGGSGFTGGGGSGAGGGGAGGNSSRDGGLTNTFTGGTATSTGGGGGAGFLANGSNSTSAAGGAGGSGGGGGGGAGSSANSGAGGNGCVLIYY